MRRPYNAEKSEIKNYTQSTCPKMLNDTHKIAEQILVLAKIVGKKAVREKCFYSTRVYIGVGLYIIMPAPPKKRKAELLIGVLMRARIGVAAQGRSQPNNLES